MSTALKIKQSNIQKASGALPKLIPSSALPTYLRDVQCEIEGGGVINWVTVTIIPSPSPQDEIYNIAFSGIFEQIDTDNFVHIFLSSPSNPLILSSQVLTGFFTFQKNSSSYNLPYYWDVVSSTVNYIVLRFQKKDLVVSSSEPLVFSTSINLF
jgi:hypothetical protein